MRRSRRRCAGSPRAAATRWTRRRCGSCPRPAVAQEAPGDDRQDLDASANMAWRRSASPWWSVLLLWLHGPADRALAAARRGARRRHAAHGRQLLHQAARSPSSPPNSPTRSNCSCAACAPACRSPRRSAWSRSEVAGPVGEEFRSVTDKIKIGRTMDVGAAGNRRSARHARIPVLRHHPRDPARDRRQSGGNAVQPRRPCCASAAR